MLELLSTCCVDCRPPVDLLSTLTVNLSTRGSDRALLWLRTVAREKGSSISVKGVQRCCFAQLGSFEIFTCRFRNFAVKRYSCTYRSQCNKCTVRSVQQHRVVHQQSNLLKATYLKLSVSSIVLPLSLEATKRRKRRALLLLLLLRLRKALGECR